MRRLLVGASLLVACSHASAPTSKSEPARSVTASPTGQRCTSRIDEIEARLLHERDTRRVLAAIGSQLSSTGYKLPEVTTCYGARLMMGNAAA